MIPPRSLAPLGLAIVLAGLFASCDATKGGSASDASKFYSDPKMIALAEAVEREDLPGIERSLADGADLNGVGSAEIENEKQSVTPLTWAYLHQKQKSFERLLESARRSEPASPRWPLGDGLWCDRPGSVLAQAVARPWRRPKSCGRRGSHAAAPRDLAGAKGTHPAPDPGRGRPRSSGQCRQFSVDCRRHGARWFEAVFQLLQAGADFQHASPPDDPSRLAQAIIFRDVLRESTQWQLREKVIDFLVEHGFDFEPGLEQVAERYPAVAEVWQQQMQERQASRQTASPDQP